MASSVGDLKTAGGVVANAVTVAGVGAELGAVPALGSAAWELQRAIESRLCAEKNTCRHCTIQS